MADLRESAVGPAQLACNGGNGVIRTPTRRRHAGGRLHMAQKPLCRSAWRAARGLLEWKWLRCRWVVAGPVGKRPPDWRAARGLLGWRRLRRRWAVAGLGRASRSSTPSEARVWRSRGRAAAHRRTEQPRAARRVRAGRPRAARRSGGGRLHGGLAAGGRTEVWRREAARRSGGGRPHRAAVGRPRALTRSLGDSGFDQ